jgi:hypothetical protein
MSGQRARWLVLWGLALMGCVSARPVFEQRFNPSFHSHDQWMSLLTTRYGCDTVLLNAGTPTAQQPRAGVSGLARRSRQSIAVGMRPCVLAGVVAPETVRAWPNPDGLREEWVFRSGSGPVMVVYLQGIDEQDLRVVSPIP